MCFFVVFTACRILSNACTEFLQFGLTTVSTIDVCDVFSYLLQCNPLNNSLSVGN